MSSIQSSGHPSSRRYNASFKLKAAQMVLKQNLSISQVAAKLRCSPMSVRKWVEQHRDPPTSEVSFLPVQVVDASQTSRVFPCYEIVTLKGLTLRLPDETTIRVITELVRELELASC